MAGGARGRGALPRVARPVRARGGGPSRGRRRGGVGAAPAAGHDRRCDPRPHSYRPCACARSRPPTRRRAASKIASALAFWASSYQELPGPPLLIGREGVAEALADLPYLPADAPAAVLISDRVAAVADIADEFEQAVASLGWTGSAMELLDQLAAGGAAAYLRNADDGRCHRTAPFRDLAARVRARSAVASRGGPGRRRGLRLAGRGGLARCLRHRPGHACAPRSQRPRPTTSSTARWPPGTSTRSSCARLRCEPSGAVAIPPCSWPQPTPALGSEPRRPGADLRTRPRQASGAEPGPR